MNPNAKPFVFNPSAASWGSAPAVVSASLPSDELVDKSVNAAASVDGQGTFISL